MKEVKTINKKYFTTKKMILRFSKRQLTHAFFANEFLYIQKENLEDTKFSP